jgi:hypothetical protein
VSTPKKKTVDDLNALKRSWLADPCWPIEETEGFEEWHDTLLDFRLRTEAEWQSKHRQKMMMKALKLGVPGNVQLAEYVTSLENRLATLEAWAEKQGE